MYIYIRIYAYIYMHVCICIYMCVCALLCPAPAHTTSLVCLCIYVYIYIHIFMYMLMSVLQCVAVCCSVLQCTATHSNVFSSHPFVGSRHSTSTNQFRLDALCTTEMCSAPSVVIHWGRSQLRRWQRVAHSKAMALPISGGGNFQRQWPYQSLEEATLNPLFTEGGRNCARAQNV